MLFIDDDGVQHRVVCGSIRKVSGSWVVVDDSINEPSDLSINAVNSSGIQVTFPACPQLETFIVAPDSILAGAHTICFGASVGLNSATISGRVDGGPFNPVTWPDSSAKIRIYGLFRA